MHIEIDRLRVKIIQEIRALASLAPIFALALLLAWLLSGEAAISFFESPTSPPPKASAPTETPVPPATATSEEVPPTPTPTASPTELTAVPSASSTEQAKPATAAPAEPSPSQRGSTLWPWVLLGALSIGAIAAGVFLLR